MKIQKMKVSNILLEEALFNSHLNTLNSLCESDLRELDNSLTEDELQEIMESFKQDPEALLEFLGTIAGLGMKASRYATKKLGGFRFNHSLKKANKAHFKNTQEAPNKTRKAYINATNAYGKELARRPKKIGSMLYKNDLITARRAHVDAVKAALKQRKHARFAKEDAKRGIKNQVYDHLVVYMTGLILNEQLNNK